VRLLRGEADQATHLISLLQQRYAKEPGVMESLARILVQFGIITPDGRPAQDVSAAGPAAVEQGVAAESKIWTPDAPQSPGQPKQESKLWVPGMD
jgi:hypothetical protein